MWFLVRAEVPSISSQIFSKILKPCLLKVHMKWWEPRGWFQVATNRPTKQMFRRILSVNSRCRLPNVYFLGAWILTMLPIMVANPCQPPNTIQKRGCERRKAIWNLLLSWLWEAPGNLLNRKSPLMRETTLVTWAHSFSILQRVARVAGVTQQKNCTVLQRRKGWKEFSRIGVQALFITL